MNVTSSLIRLRMLDWVLSCWSRCSHCQSSVFIWVLLWLLSAWLRGKHYVAQDLLYSIIISFWFSFQIFIILVIDTIICEYQILFWIIVCKSQPIRIMLFFAKIWSCYFSWLPPCLISIIFDNAQRWWILVHYATGLPRGASTHTVICVAWSPLSLIDGNWCSISKWLFIQFWIILIDLFSFEMSVMRFKLFVNNFAIELIIRYLYVIRLLGAHDKTCL